MKRLLYIFLFSASALSAQTAVWPNAVVTDSQLLVAANFCGSRLSGSIQDTTSTTIFVTNATLTPTCFLANEEVQVDNEMMQITSVGFGQLTVIRGFDNSTASTHNNNAPINNVPAAWYHNALRVEVESIETWLKNGGGGGGGGNPGGLNGTIQYNNNGAFGGYSVLPAAVLPAATNSGQGAVQLPTGATTSTLGTSAVPSTYFYVTPGIGPYQTIQAAITAAQTAGGPGGGGTIVLPNGTITITSTITLALANSGIIIQGQGIPYNCYPYENSNSAPTPVLGTCTGGTVLYWAGASNGTMFDIVGSSHITIRDLKIDGGMVFNTDTSVYAPGVLGRAIEVESPATQASQNDIINVEIWYVNGSPGTAVEACAISSLGCTETRLDRVLTTHDNIGFYQDNGQSFSYIHDFYSVFNGIGIQMMNGYLTLKTGEFSGSTSEGILLGGFQNLGQIVFDEMDYEDGAPLLVALDSTNSSSFPIVHLSHLRALYVPHGTPGTLIQWGVGGIGIPTYVSGGTLTGTGTCLLAASGGGGTGGQLSMSVSGGAFASFSITAAGSGYTSEPTSWTYVSGAACSTTVTTSGGSSGGAGGVLDLRENRFSTLYSSSNVSINLLQGGGGASLYLYDIDNIYSGVSTTSITVQGGTVVPTTLNSGILTGQKININLPNGGATSTAWLTSKNASAVTLGTCDYTLLCSGAAFLSPFTSPTAAISNGAMFLGSLKVMGWSSTTAWNGGVDTAISRQNAGILAVGNGTAGNSSGGIKAAAYMSVGTKYTTNAGCSETGLTGGATAGYLHSGTSGTCTFVITMGNSMTAPNGWHCSMTNFTTPTDVVRQTNLSTTTATMSGTTVTNDLLVFSCEGF